MTKKTILFICVENANRSIMAETFARHHGGEEFEIYSAGSKPSGKVNPDALKVLQEKNINISAAHSKGFKELPVQKFDYAVAMGCADTCPYVPTIKYIEWNIEDPKGKSLDTFRKVRDEIEQKVLDLLKEIKHTMSSF